MRRFAPALVTSLAAFVVVATASRAAHADDCPAGSWFCQPAPPPAAAQPQAAPASAPTPGTMTTTTTTTTTTTHLPPPLPPPQAAPPQTIPLPPREEPRVIPLPPPREAVPPPPPTVVVHDHSPTPIGVKNQWGLSLHGGGLILGSKSNDAAGMGMLGGGLRIRPTPYFALEGDLDLAAGRDYYARTRSEAALSVNGMVFLNPRDRVQFYLLGGFGWSAATVREDGTSNVTLANGEKRDFTYFGVQAGAGLEWRLSQGFALNGDVRGIIRGRTDDNRNSQPEFVDNNGRSTNTSGAGLVTLGMTIYF